LSFQQEPAALEVRNPGAMKKAGTWRTLDRTEKRYDKNKMISWYSGSVGLIVERRIRSWKQE